MSQFFIDRPIFATVLSIVILILGGVALVGLPVAQYPDVTPPTIQIQAFYPGAGAQVVADTVTTPIEQEVNGVENMLYVSSKSTGDGQCVIDVTFSLGTDIDQAQVLTQNRVAVALAKLPEEVRRQGVTTKKKASSILLCVNLYSPDGRYDQLYLSNYAFIQVKDALARLDGVGDVAFLGARDYAMRVWLDPDALASRGMTAADVVRSLREQNVQVAAGQLGQPPAPAGIDFQLPVRASGRLLTAEEFAEVIVKSGGPSSRPQGRDGFVTGGEIVRLSDVGRVELGARNSDMTSRLDGRESITIAVFQRPGSNALATAAGVRREMEKLAAEFPAGLAHAIHYDTTVFVDESVHEVFKTLFEALALVFLVVLIFLQSWRATIIPMIAVPVSLVGTFAVMRILGFSLNNLSLFGLVLAIGIVVDDAIVVVENVDRWLAEGLGARDAARRAMAEVSGPVVAIALVLCAVFVPTAFITGISGEFYRQFALTIAASTVISAFNSLTLSPALAAILFRGHERSPGMGAASPAVNPLLAGCFRVFNLFVGLATGAYGAVVGLLLRATIVVVAAYVGLMALTYYGFTTVPVGFIPEQDKGYLVVNALLPDGASSERTAPVVERLTREALDTPGVAHVISVSGYSLVSSVNLPNSGGMFVLLEPFARRKADPALHATAIAKALRGKFAAIQEAQVVTFGAPAVEGMGTTGGFKLQVRDRGARGPGPLEAAVANLSEAAAAQPGLVGIFSSFRASQPQVFVEVDRAKVKAQGVDLTDVNQTLQIYLGGAYVNDFTAFGRNWQVNVQADQRFRMRTADIGRLKVRNAAGDMVPLSTLVTIRDESGPSIVTRYNLYPAAELSGSTLPGTSSGDAIAILEELAGRPPTGRGILPPGMDFEWTELSLQQVLAGNTAAAVFALGTLFVFLVLAAQYESWSLPLAIILVVPTCLVAAIAGLWIAGLDNNIFTQIGLVVLIGLAAKNSILIVEFASEREKAGVPRAEAVLEAAKLRLRPIVMTSLAFILGVVPLVLGRGAGAEMRVALGTAVFSGMIGVTVFGIFFTPVFYVIVRRFSPAVGKKGGPARLGAG